MIDNVEGVFHMEGKNSEHPTFAHRCERRLPILWMHIVLSVSVYLLFIKRQSSLI